MRPSLLIQLIALTTVGALLSGCPAKKDPPPVTQMLKPSNAFISSAHAEPSASVKPPAEATNQASVPADCVPPKPTRPPAKTRKIVKKPVPPLRKHTQKPSLRSHDVESDHKGKKEAEKDPKKVLDRAPLPPPPT